MKKGELYDFYVAAEEINLVGGKWNHQFGKNLRKIGHLIKKWDKDNREPSEDYKAFKQLVEKDKQEFAKKDDKGQFILLDSTTPDGRKIKTYDIEGINDPNSEFRLLMTRREIENKVIIDIQKERERKFVEEFLEEEVSESDFKPGLVNINDLPDGYTKEIDAVCYWMVDDNARA